ncbi:MAG: hypothetical protein ACPGQD_01285 [Planctomycetota bacterium]
MGKVIQLEHRHRHQTWGATEMARRVVGVVEQAKLLVFPPPKAAPVERGDIILGAWTGSPLLRNPAKECAFATHLGLSRLDPMVNTFSMARRATKFKLRKSARSTKRWDKVFDEAFAHGIEIHLVAWPNPNPSYINSMAAEIMPLLNDYPFASICHDTEEPWTTAEGFSHAEAGMRISDAFADRPCPMGATGIGYVGRRGNFSQLARHCDYLMSQGYSLHSDVAPEKFGKRYLDLFSIITHPGLAAYRQKKTKSSRVGARMAVHYESLLRYYQSPEWRAAADDAIRGPWPELARPAAVYWSLGWLHNNRTARQFLINLQAQPLAVAA